MVADEELVNTKVPFETKGSIAVAQRLAFPIEIELLVSTLCYLRWISLFFRDLTGQPLFNRLLYPRTTAIAVGKARIKSFSDVVGQADGDARGHRIYGYDCVMLILYSSILTIHTVTSIKFICEYV